MVITRVVEDQYHCLSPPIMGQQLLKKGLEALGVELVFAADDQTTVGFAHRAKYRHAFPRGGMKEDGVHNLRRHPHHAAGTMLLEMAFVLKPQLKGFASGEAQEFFYIAAGLRGQHGQGGDVACADGNPACGTSADIGGRRWIRDNAGPGDD